MKVPKWLKLQGEIDFRIYLLGQMLKRERNLAGLEKMIDKATGFDKQKRKEATRLMSEINKLKTEFEELEEGVNNEKR